VVPSALLEVLNTSGQDVRMLAGRVPSLNIESSFGRAFPRFYIRGYGNTDFRLNASQPVSLMYDEVVQENPILKGFPAFDLARVEVLRGPQGSLFGRNTPAGVVKFESVRPALGKTEGYGSLSLGTFSTVNAEAAVNAAMGAGSALRLSLLSQTRDDWVKNTYSAGPTQDLEGYRDNALRLQWLMEPSKDLSALFNVHARDYDGSARLFRANIIATGTNDFVPGFDERKISIDGKNESELQNYGANLRLRLNLGGGLSLHLITGYEQVKTFSRGDIDGGFGAAFLPPGASGPGVIPFASETADGIPKHSQWTQELRLESDTKGPLDWQAGVFLFKEDYRIESFSYDSTAANKQEGYERVRQKNDAYAVFGALNYAAGPQLKLRGGLRYTKDKKDFVADRLQAPPFSPPFIGRLTKNTDATNTSFDLSGTYALNRDANLYARVATGFRAPAMQGRLLFGDIVSVANSEKVQSVEAGVKADLLDRRARVAFNLFHYTIKNQQLTAVGGNANFNQLVNAAKGIGQGAEFDGQFLATDRLLLTLNGSLNKTRIKDPNLRVDACASGCTILDPITAPANPAIGKFAPTVSIDGNSLPQAPKVVLNLTARYGFPLAGGDAYVLGDVSYRSKISYFLYESVEFTGKPLTEAGLRAGYIWANGKYEASAFVRNIADRVQVIYGIDFNNLLGVINEPRTFGLQFKAAF